MNLNKYLAIAGLSDPAIQAQVAENLALADQRRKGLLWFKIKARFFKASSIAESLTWSSNRLIEVRPDLRDYDIAPVTKVTCNGDNGPWEGPIGNDRPVPNPYLNPDPSSDEYRQAVESNYWKKGYHPRSFEARKAWYRRNAGELKAYELGQLIPTDLSSGRSIHTVQVFRGVEGRISVELWCCNGVWLLKVFRRVIGRYGIKIRKGFEVDNVFSGTTSPQAWFPLEGFPLMASVTWSTIPGKN